jgi:hypothetical protein
VDITLPPASARDLNVGIAFFVARHAPAALARKVRAEKRVIHADPNVLAFGNFAGDGTTADLEGLRLTPAQLTAFARAAPGTDLNLYPDGRPGDFAEDLYWVQFRANGEDTIALEHVFQATFDEVPVLVQRQYYVSASYNAEQAIVGFLPVGDVEDIDAEQQDEQRPEHQLRAPAHL